MKKLLLIIVLGWMLSGNAYAVVSKKLQQEYIDSGMIKVGMKMSDFYPLVKSLEATAFVPNYKTGGKYLFILTSQYANTQVYLAEATNSNPKKNKSAWGTVIGWKLEKYKLIKIYNNPIEAFDYLISLEKDRKGFSRIMKAKARYIKYNQEPTKTIQSNTASSGSSSMNTEDKKVEIASMIDRAKKTCKDLGFQEGTSKFADCSLKLYSQSLDLAAEKKQTVVMQPQSSGSNKMTIYDPVRDANALIKQGQRMMSGACTLGINC